MFGLKGKAAATVDVRETWRALLDDFIIDLAWSPNGDRLAIATVDGRVSLASFRGPPRLLGSHAGGASSIAWRPDGQALASGGLDGWVRVWDPVTGAESQQLAAGGDWVAKVAYRPRGGELAAAAGKTLRIWNIAGETLYESACHASTVSDLAWNPDGSAVATTAYLGIVLHVRGHADPPRKLAWKGSSLTLAWSPTARFIATGEQDSTVHFWHVKTGKDAQMWGFPRKVLELSWHHAGNHLATGGSDTVVLWDCGGKGPEGRTPTMLEGHPTRITQLAFQPQGELLASADADGTLLLWNPLRATRPAAGRMFLTEITRVAWTPDGKRLAIGERAGSVAVVDVGA
jgi:WD40 repeat protein